MKNRAFSLLVSIALLSFASCSDEMQELANEQSQALKQIVMTAQDFQPEAGSRTVYQIADGAVKCTWAANDTVGVFPDKGAQAYFPMASGAGTKNATFDGEGWALKDGRTYGAYYPFVGAMYLDRNAVPVSYTGQTQVGNASMDHLGAYDYMVATPTAPEFGSAKFMFKHLSALVQLKLTVPQPAAITSVKLVAETKAFALEGKVDIMTSEPCITPVTTAKEMELTLLNVKTTEENQVVTLYLMLPPANLSKQTLKAVITSDKGTQELDFEGKNFQAGMAYGLSGELESTDAGYKDGVVSLAEAGTMKQLLGDDWLNITSLKVVGPINGDDVYCLRQMMGGYAEPEIGKLTSIDLSEASIVKGGRYYRSLNEDMLELKYCYTSNDVIGEYMFADCSNLQSVILPDNATLIRYNAFRGSSYLKSVELPDGITSIGKSAFYDCSALVDINIPDEIISIGDHAFNNCSSLRSIHIPDGVTSIGEGTFYDCSSLESIILGKDITFIGNGAFNGCSSLESIHIPNGVMSIGDHAFNDCTSLTSVRIPDVVTSINERTFYGCASLVSITLGEGITSIGSDAFSGCSSLEGIQMPDGVKSIGDCAFYGCFSLKSINIPNGVTSIEEQTFRDCSSLESIAIPDGLTSIGQSAFYNCSSLGSIDIPDGVTSIGKQTFYNCTALTSVTVGKGVTSIDNYAFYKCSSLESINIPDDVTSIGYQAFYNCSSLTSINVPDGVTSIAAYTFSGCSSLSSVSIGKGVTSIGENAFGGTSSLNSVYISDLSAWCKIEFNGLKTSPLHNGTRLYLNNIELTELVIPEGITDFSTYAFRNCSSIRTITIKNSVKTTASQAFSGCSSLSNVIIGEGVTSIGQQTFEDCSSLTSVTIGEDVTSIGKNAFSKCPSLSSVYITDLSAWCKITFSYRESNPLSNGARLYLNNQELTEMVIPEEITEINNYTFTNCLGLNKVNIGNNVTSIGSTAFAGCSSLTSVTISQNVTSIGASAFSSCSSLKSINIPNGVTSIKDATFASCSSLKSINIPNGVISIGMSAFSRCRALTDVYCYATTPPEISAFTFDYNDQSTLHVPVGCSERYITADYWDTNFENIVEMK